MAPKISRGSDTNIVTSHMHRLSIADFVIYSPGGHATTRRRGEGTKVHLGFTTLRDAQHQLHGTCASVCV
eukprot:4237891-Amphidinium_carterae.1